MPSWLWSPYQSRTQACRQKQWTKVLAHYLILASLICKRIYKTPINVGDINALCQYLFSKTAELRALYTSPLRIGDSNSTEYVYSVSSPTFRVSSTQHNDMNQSMFRPRDLSQLLGTVIIYTGWKHSQGWKIQISIFQLHNSLITKKRSNITKGGLECSFAGTFVGAGGHL